MKDSNQNIDFSFGENNNYHRVGVSHFENELKVEKDVDVAASRILVNEDVIRLVNNTFAYCFKEALSGMTGGSVIEHNKFCGPISTTMRSLTSKSGDLLSHFDKIDETAAQKKNTSLKHHLVNNHDEDANKGKK